IFVKEGHLYAISSVQATFHSNIVDTLRVGGLPTVERSKGARRPNRHTIELSAAVIREMRDHDLPTATVSCHERISARADDWSRLPGLGAGCGAGIDVSN